jgi:hypothetical protein
MMEPTNIKHQQEAAAEKPWGRILRHRRTLDDSLSSIKGRTDESEMARMYIAGQIEALDWVISYLE